MAETSELRAVLDDLDARVGSAAAANADLVAERVHDVVDHPGPARRRRVYLVAAACAAVAAVGLVPTLLAGQARHPVAPPTPPRPAPGSPLSTPLPRTGPGQSPPLQFGFELRLPHGFVSRPGSISADKQSMTAGHNGRAYVIEVYAPGSFDPTKTEQIKPAMISGRGGYYGNLPSGNADQPSVMWQYASDAWAVVSPGRHQSVPSVSVVNVLNDEQALAESVREGFTSMPVPFRLAAVPQGVVFRGISAGLDLPPSAGPVSSLIVLSNGQVADPASVPMDLMVQSSSFDHRYCTSKYWTRMTLGISHVDQVELGGHSGCVLVAKSGQAAGAFVRLGPHYYVEIHVYPEYFGMFSRAQVESLAASVSVVPDIAKTRTWLPATVALAH